MLKFKNFLFPLILVGTFHSCKIYKRVDLPKQDGIQGYQGSNPSEESQIADANTKRLEIYNLERPFIKNPDQLEWGLAMSGGGIRSATYNFGALKALYDLGLLQKMQIISSVSGGGYTSFGLYANYENHKSEGKPFGFYSFDDSVFLKQGCTKQGQGNFVTNGKYLLALISPPKGAFNIYRRRIERGFSYGQSPSFKLTNLNTEIKRGEAPYFIINTTQAAQKESDWLSSVVEFTPAFYGNPELGLTEWNESYIADWSEAITMSAAALRFKLLNKVPYNGDAISTSYMALSDGGHSENLAAISLIRRGVKNIVVIDAEHNRDYSFDGYIKLKNELKEELNLHLEIETIDNFIDNNKNKSQLNLETAVHTGTISRIPLNDGSVSSLILNIYYVKMSMPENTLTLRANSDLVNQGRNENDKVEILSCVDKKGNKCKKHDCNSLDKYVPQDLKSLALSWVHDYANFLDSKKKWKRLGYTFPHTTTADQSFFRDQLRAFIGLGYLQASELNEILQN